MLVAFGGKGSELSNQVLAILSAKNFIFSMRLSLVASVQCVWMVLIQGVKSIVKVLGYAS